MQLHRIVVAATVVAFTLPLLAGCGRNEVFVVTHISDEVNPDATVDVTCTSTSDAGKTKTVRHHLLVQIAPAVGEEWFCNRPDGS